MALRNQKSKEYEGINNIWEVYERYWKAFGELLTEMEREGFKINLEHMREIELKAMERISEKRA